ncbi:MAG: hypothetical protein WC788_00585 [Candidatus Paceibacterota bacterium]|jgi:hypothetical protein
MDDMDDVGESIIFTACVGILSFIVSLRIFHKEGVLSYGAIDGALIVALLIGIFVALFKNYAVFIGIKELKINPKKKVFTIGTLVITMIAATAAVFIAPKGWWPIYIAYFFLLAIVFCLIRGACLMKEERSNSLPET